MKHLFVLLSVGFGFNVTAQKTSPEKFGATITANGLKQHLQVLAAPGMEGRETGMPGERRAAAYIKEQFKKMGLAPGNGNNYEMPFTVYRDSLVNANITVNGKTYMQGNDFGTYENHTGEGKFSEVVFAGYGVSTRQYDDYKSLDVAGKLVVVYEGEPIKNGVYLATGSKKPGYWTTDPYEKSKAATKHGAAALLIIERAFPKNGTLVRLGDMYTDGYKSRQMVNTFFISETMAEEIFKHQFREIRKNAGDSLKKLNGVRAEISLAYHGVQQVLPSANVMGVIEGSDKKDEYVFVTAHYDHLGKKEAGIYCGADDNASGTSGVLKIAEAFAEAKKQGNGPRRTMVFMLVSGEEKGLWGSEKYTENPIYPFEKTTVDLNIDMIGRTGYDYTGTKDAVNYIYVIGDDKLSSDLRPINERNNRITKLKLDYKYNAPDDPNRFYYRSDHYNFAKKGVPVIFYFDGENEDYHKPTDTMEKINFELMSRRAQLVFYTAWEMANMDRMLKRDIPLR